MFSDNCIQTVIQFLTSQQCISVSQQKKIWVELDRTCRVTYMMLTTSILSHLYQGRGLKTWLLRHYKQTVYHRSKR